MGAIDFTGQAAIVTGAGAGIGRATALLLAARGAAVLVNDADRTLAESVAGEIRAAGGRAQADATPVGGHEAARTIARTATDAFGRIDILVNNAGIASPGPFGHVADDQIDRVLEVNLLGPFALMRAIWPAMRAQGHGRIVNTSSDAALGTGISGPYAASKAGLIGLTKDAALSGEPLGIKVNALMPSASTQLLEKHPDPNFRAWFARHMPAELVAPVTAYLASRDCVATGEIFTAGGGRVCRLAFLESRGILDPALTPEAVAQAMPEICHMAGGQPLSFLKDHSALYEAAFPD